MEKLLTTHGIPVSPAHQDALRAGTKSLYLEPIIDEFGTKFGVASFVIRLTRRAIYADVVTKRGHIYPGVICPYGCIGDVLWIYEPWQVTHWDARRGEVCVRYGDGAHRWCASPAAAIDKLAKDDAPHRAHPGVAMPIWASRYYCNVADVQICPVLSLTDADRARLGVASLAQEEDWCVSRHGDFYAWEKNPWVWIVTLDPIDPPPLSKLLTARKYRDSARMKG